MVAKKRSVLITGVAHPWGKKLLPLLEEDPSFDSIIGIDYKAPEYTFNRMEFFQIEPHHPLLAELLKVAEVDTVCHLLFEDAYSPSEEIFDLNVMGTMDLLAACGAGEVQRMVVMSDTKVYGAVPNHPNFLYETTEFKGRARHPYVGHRMEIERIVDRYCRQNELPKVAILRFANILGHGMDTPMARYLEPHAAPIVFGFDPMVQFTHAEDVTAALFHTVKNEIDGAFNIAGDGLLPLSQVLKLGRRVPVPLGAPLVRAGAMFLQKTSVPDSIPISTGYMKYNCVGDTDKMKKVLGFTPKYDSKQVVLDFFENHRLSRYLPKKPGIKSDPKATEELQEYLKARRRANDFIGELIESFQSEEGHDQ